jgi:preprotein translocase subunit SecY
VLAIPQTVLQFIAYDPNVPDWRFQLHSFFTGFHGGDPYYELIYLSLIVLFTFFYITIIFNVEEVSDNLRKHGGFIPGIRPGRPTAEYLQYVLSRITLPGSIYLGIVAVLPNFFLSITQQGQNQNFPFGGTAVLIMVGVGLETVKQIETQLNQRNYEGFLK